MEPVVGAKGLGGRLDCFNHSTKSMEYLVEKYDELVKKYDKKWIAIDGRGVVEQAETIEQLRHAIKKHAHPECMVVQYVTTEPIAMFF